MKTPSRLMLSLLLTLALVPFGALFAQVQLEWLARYDSAQHRDLQAGVAWSRRFDRGEQDRCNDIALDAAGNGYATGVTDTLATYLDFTMLKYDASGTWAEHYNGPDIPIPADEAIAVAVTPANAVIVTGSSTAVNQLSDIVTIKYVQP